MTKKIEECLEEIEELIKDIDRAFDAAKISASDTSQLNERMYKGIKGDAYLYSYVNPEYAEYALGKEIGPLMAFVAYEAYTYISFKFDGKVSLFKHYLQLLDDIKSLYNNSKLTYESCYEAIYKYLTLSFKDFSKDRIKDMIQFSKNRAYQIICEESLEDVNYLYKFGEYISKDEIDIARYLNLLSEESIRKMAEVFTQGYKRGFEATKRPWHKKETVTIIYSLGFERLVREEIKLFEEMGLKTCLFRNPKVATLRRGTSRNGFSGADSNPQATYDHSRDIIYFTDNRLNDNRLKALEEIYKSLAKEADAFGGPAVMETFGEEPFDYKESDKVLKASEKQKELDTEYRSKQAALVNKFIKGEERSFTIIAYPTPVIGKDFKEIFARTIELNTLDNDLYRDIQQHLIDALNTAKEVRIKGANGNKTDLTVRLMKVEDTTSQENFENCLADVNIPVGEVFTSPVLKGTSGILNVSRVFLNGYEFKDLCIEIQDGKVKDYTCSNFENEEKNKAYFKKNVLYNHETLPMGEFAIGTNTSAYKMIKDYNIASIMPILIAEKCGPHFALGDTCYSHAEDVKVYNQNGKEIIAKDNEVSCLRKSSFADAYFNCHTDITIPYEEIESLAAITYDGEERVIINKGRFVLEGTQVLNKALED